MCARAGDISIDTAVAESVTVISTVTDTAVHDALAVSSVGRATLVNITSQLTRSWREREREREREKRERESERVRE